MTAVLDVQDLHACFRTKKGLIKAVDGVSFHVDEGEIIGLLGESGCGLAAAMLATVQALPKPGGITGGRVIFYGEDILQLRANEPAMRSIRGKKISFVFREPVAPLNPALSIGRQLTGILEKHPDTDDKAARERAVELLAMVGIPDAGARIDDRLAQFSAVMRQRVMIALALASNPAVIVADEPANVADVTIRAQLLDMLEEMVTRFNTALIILTRNPGVLTRYARRVYVIYAGRIVESGPSEAVFNSPRHPYTLGLLRSTPRPGENKTSKKLAPVYGFPPDLIDMSPHCAFLSRCTYKTERCKKDSRPEMRPVGEGHYTACHFDLREMP